MNLTELTPTRTYAAGPAEFDGGDLVTHLDADTDACRAWLKAKLDEHHVVFLLGQQLDAVRLHGLVNSLGSMCDPPFLRSEADAHGVVRVVRSAGESGVTPFGWGWHSDWTFLDRPPRYSLLYSVVVPQRGGDTLWSNQVTAFDRLSDPVKDVLRSQIGLHSARMSYGLDGTYAKDLSQRSMPIDISEAADHVVKHPAVLQRADGSEALYLNESYVVGLDGWREWESQGLLQFLFRWQSIDDFVCRYQWAPSTLAVWDNHAVIHRALDDCRGQHREFLRATFDM